MKNIVIKSLIVVFLLSTGLLNLGKAIAEENQLKDVIKLVMPATVLVMTYDAKGKPLTQGSGFFVSETGELITNYHVFKDAESIEIKCPDNSVYKISLVIAEDLTSDLVKLQANTGGKKVPWLKLNKAKIEVGEKIVVIGSPKGLEATVSDGIVSAVRDVPGFGNIIQITAPISPGSSGSAVVNMKGEVMGVASAQILEGQNLNFVVPAEWIIGLKGKKKSFLESKSEEVEKQNKDVFDKAFFYLFRGDYAKALPFFKQYVKDNQHLAGLCWLEMGYCYEELDRFQEAIEAFKQAIQLDVADISSAYHHLGNAYTKIGRYKDAIETCKESIKLYPDHPGGYFYLGNAYDESGRYQEAIKAFKQAIKLNPDYYADAQHNLAFAYAKIGHYQEAIQACKQAIKLQPDDAGAHYGLGVVYLLIEDKGGALEEYKILKTLNPELANKLFNKIYK